MEYKELRKAIQTIISENFDGFDDESDEYGNWSDFDSKEMMGNAQKSAMKDIEGSGEEFEPLGKSKFEKNLDINELIADLEAQKYNKAEKTLKRIQKQIDQLKRFG